MVLSQVLQNAQDNRLRLSILLFLSGSCSKTLVFEQLN
jgi:hypothetical protein